MSLQLAAAQLTAGNKDVRYRKMGLHLMPYGPSQYDPSRISAGSLELLGQKAIVRRDGEFDIPDNAIGSQNVWGQGDDVELEDAVDAARDARLVIMNPPFTSRAKMGEKFPKGTQQRLRTRVDAMEQNLVRNDRDMDDFAGKNSIGPLFVALADHCVERSNGTLTMVNPTIALTTSSGQQERLALAQRFHIHTVVTSHQPQNINMSQHTAINESIVVMRRHVGPKPPTRFINLDRMPVDDGEVADFHGCLLDCEEGLIVNGWGEVSYWPADMMESGDWSAAIWRSPELALAASRFANHPDLRSIGEIPSVSIHDTGRSLRGSFKPTKDGTPGAFPILKSKGAEGQLFIQSTPDEHWLPKNDDDELRRLNGGTFREAGRLLQKTGHLLITAGQDNSTARLTTTAGDAAYVGNGWMPVTGLSPNEAKATSVFINSVAGRLQLMRNPGRKLAFPEYSVAEASNIRVPNIRDERVRQILADCWERTKDIEVPQFRDGECEVRRLWDEAVAEAMGWDADELGRLRQLLHQEPHVRGLGYGQYADEVEE